MDNKEQSIIVASNNQRQGAINVPKHNGASLQDGEVIKTRSRQIVKNQTDSYTCSTNYQPSQHVSHSTKCHTSQPCYLMKINTFLYDILLAGQQTDIAHS